MSAIPPETLTSKGLLWAPLPCPFSPAKVPLLVPAFLSNLSTCSCPSTSFLPFFPPNQLVGKKGQNNKAAGFFLAAMEQGKEQNVTIHLPSPIVPGILDRRPQAAGLGFGLALGKLETTTVACGLMHAKLPFSLFSSICQTPPKSS